MERGKRMNFDGVGLLFRLWGVVQIKVQCSFKAERVH